MFRGLEHSIYLQNAIADPSTLLVGVHVLRLTCYRQFGAIENLSTAAFDAFPKLRTKKWLVSGVLCAVLYVAGFSMCTKVYRRNIPLQFVHTTLFCVIMNIPSVIC